MCGVIMALGKVNMDVFDSLLYESEIRGIHNIGRIQVSDKCWIGHTRYSTSGEVHQPLVLDKKRILAFNGIISMLAKKEMEKHFKIKMLTDNDGEVLLQKCKGINDVPGFIDDPNISFAGVIVFGKNAYAIRNARRPLWTAFYKGCTYIASTKDIFERAGIKKSWELDEMEIYSWKI